MPEVPAIQPLDNPLTGLIRLQELQGLAQERQMRGQELQARAQELQQRQQQMQAAQAAQQRASQVWQNLPRTPDDLVDIPGLMSQLGAAGAAPKDLEGFATTAEKMNQIHTSYRQQQKDHLADLANVLLEGHDEKNPVTQDSIHLGLAAARGMNLASDDDVQQMTNALSQGVDPNHVLKTVRGLGSKWAKPPELKEVPAGGSLVSVAPGGQATTVFAGAPKAPTAEEDNAKAIALRTKQRGGTPLTSDEQNWLDSYKEQRLQGPEASAVAAADRQARGIEAAAARQAESERARIAADTRRQTFQEQESGRDKLTKEETKYHDALAQAQALRDTVASAQAGNKVAASMQSLETAMAAIRAQGLNRINAVEIGMPASAGNAWDRIQGWFGKATEGQPVPKDIQKDMTDFATMLERTAYNKYSTSHKSITGRYNLRDETPEPAPPSTVTGGPRTGGKGDPLGIR